MSSRPYLVDQMRTRADRDRLPAHHAVRLAAKKLEVTLTAHKSTPLDVRRVAKQTRMVWLQYSGEKIDD